MCDDTAGAAGMMPTCDGEMWFQHCEWCDDAQLAGTL